MGFRVDNLDCLPNVFHDTEISEMPLLGNWKFADFLKSQSMRFHDISKHVLELKKNVSDLENRMKEKEERDERQASEMKETLNAILNKVSSGGFVPQNHSSQHQQQINKEEQADVVDLSGKSCNDARCDEKTSEVRLFTNIACSKYFMITKFRFTIISLTIIS